MRFFSRRIVKPQDLNPAGTLFGGTLLSWIDEEAAIFAICQLGGLKMLVTRHISEINFISPARNGDIIEIGFEPVEFGTTSITVRCQVRNKFTHRVIIEIEKLVFVHVDPATGQPLPHGVQTSPGM